MLGLSEQFGTRTRRLDSALAPAPVLPGATIPYDLLGDGVVAAVSACLRRGVAFRVALLTDGHDLGVEGKAAAIGVYTAHRSAGRAGLAT